MVFVYSNMPDWVELASFGTDWEATQAISFLEAGDIVAIKQGEQVFRYLRMHGSDSMNIRVFVPENQVREAYDILLDHGLIQPMVVTGKRSSRRIWNLLFLVLGVIAMLFFVLMGLLMKHFHWE